MSKLEAEHNICLLWNSNDKNDGEQFLIHCNTYKKNYILFQQYQ